MGADSRGSGGVAEAPTPITTPRHRNGNLPNRTDPKFS
ncbi:hypothetical protein AM1_C0376 (plasmid) [Acaryochloris marina MBIC11017]|uniref:Uncharacterized protein n=1 Tax=Acaryochloris marina (strain MBIC 11017) TaxID=329726 RepID=A8ZNA4_ACAM1|nr:hypothetical protein AM1_C0376 [Acaryochloris marina MBIC11017]